MRRLLLFAAGLAVASGQDAAEIVRKSLDRDHTNFERLKNYTYQQRSEAREYDSNRKLKKTEVETFEILVLARRPYARLISRDDKPLSAKEERKAQEELEKESAKRMRESASDKAKIEKERELERKYFREIPNAFVLRILGVEQVSGKPAWVIEAEPRKGYKPPSLPSANLLTKVRGKFWIDQAEHQWVKADLEAVDVLSFGLGLFRIAPGGAIHFEQTRVNDEVWLPRTVLMSASARVGLVKKLNIQQEMTFKNFRKFQADAQVVSTAVQE